MELSLEISVGDIVSAFAVVVSALGIIVALQKERALRKKELADKVRSSTALIIAKLDRWKQIALQSFDQLQAAATEADGSIVSNCDRIETRDFFWKNVVEVQAELSKSILDEEIEIAYSNLYGYDPRIQDLFSGVVKRLKYIQLLVHLQVLNRTQHDILKLDADENHPPLSAQLGNKLRHSLADSKLLLDKHMEAVLTEFRNGVKTIVLAKDNELVSRSIQIPSPEILPDLNEMRRCIVFEPPDGASCAAFFSEIKTSDFGPTVFEPWPLGIDFPEEDIRDEPKT